MTSAAKMTIDMSSFLLIAFAFLNYVCVASPATSFNPLINECKDSTDKVAFLWGKTKREYSCKKLSKEEPPAKIKKKCDKSTEANDNCRKTCDSCAAVPTTVPSVSNPNECKDSTDKVAFLYKNNRKYSCEKLSEEEPSKIKKICDKTPDAREKCKKTCDSCASAVPSSLQSSSSLPSAASVHSSLPSSLASGIPSSVLSYLPSSVPSSLPSSLASVLPSDEPSSLQSVIPSSVLSSLPSDLSSDEPSSLQSVIPSSVLSSLPSEEPCKDERDTKVDYKRATYDDNGKLNPETMWKDLNKKCFKLAEEDDETIKLACNGDIIANVCRLTCGTCPGCSDDDTLRFIFDSVSNKDKGCVWLRNQNNYDERKTLCNIAPFAKFYCKATCGVYYEWC